jgi:hypothetical protein
MVLLSQSQAQPTPQHSRIVDAQPMPPRARLAFLVQYLLAPKKTSTRGYDARESAHHRWSWKALQIQQTIDTITPGTWHNLGGAVSFLGTRDLR